MFVIEKLPAEATNLGHAVQEVADIESIVQSHDAWEYHALCDLLEQDSIDMLLVYDEQDGIDNAGKVVIGYCLYQVVFEQAEVLRIGTLPNYQRQGIASKLLTQLNKELQLRDVASLLRAVRADNAPAVALYTKHEFAVIHKRKNYAPRPYQAAVDALIMQRTYEDTP